MARRSLKISLMAWRDTPKAIAIEVAFRSKSGMKSSLSISPGWVGGNSLFAVFDMVIFAVFNGNPLFQHRGRCLQQNGNRFAIGH